MTTSFDAENMQDDIGIDPFATALPAAAPSFTSQVALAPCQTFNSGNRAGDRALASWIQRLKPRDEAETADRAEKSFVTEVKNVISAKEQQRYSGKKLQSIYEHGGGRVLSSLSPFRGRYVEQPPPIEGATPDKRLPTLSVTNSRCTSEPAIFSQTATQAVEGPSPVLHGLRAEGSFLASSLGKPPLPPHGKCGFIHMHPDSKSQGFSGWPACKIIPSVTGDKLAKALWIPSSSTKEPAYTENMSEGHFLKGRDYAKDTLEHAISSSKAEKMTLDGRNAAVDLVPGPQIIIRATDILRQDLPVSLTRTIAHLKPLEQTGSQRKEKAITTLEIQRPTKISGLTTNKLGGMKVQLVQAGGASMDSLVTEKIISKTLVDCGGRDKGEKALDAAFSASSTPTFPWETFVEPARPSRTARQEFVEVYNRARNELKKHQKATSLVTKVADNKLESFPRLAKRGVTCAESTSLVKHDAETSEAGSQQVKILQGFENASQPELQKEHLPGKLHFREGRDVETNYQAYESGHSPCGKGSSVLHGQPSGGFHCCLEQSPAAPPPCSLALGESSSFRPRLASGKAPEQCAKRASTQEELVLPKLADKSEYDNEVPVVLSKRQAGFLEEGSLSLESGKDFGKQGGNRPSKSEVWLQRWHSSQSAVQHLQEHKLLKLDRSQQGLAEDGEDKERHSKKRLIDQETSCQGIAAETELVEHFKACSENFLPSAAAMAIVGTASQQLYALQHTTASQQLYALQPQWKKSSFSFWSGFGIPPSKTSKSVVERRESRLPAASGPSSKP